MPPLIGWFDPTSHGGALRLAANSYLPAKGDAGVRLPELRRGDLVTLENGRVATVNGVPPVKLADRPEFAKLGAATGRGFDLSVRLRPAGADRLPAEGRQDHDAPGCCRGDRAQSPGSDPAHPARG